MKSIKEMTNAELAAFVESHLRKNGIDVVLSGGACVSMDLDLITPVLQTDAEYAMQ